MRTVPTKFPDKTENEAWVYTVDFSGALSSGVSVVSAVWASIPGGLVFTNEVLASPFATARISGGVAGKTYEVSVKGVTDESPTQEPEALPTLKILGGKT